MNASHRGQRSIRRGARLLSRLIRCSQRVPDPLQTLEDLPGYHAGPPLYRAWESLRSAQTFVLTNNPTAPTWSNILVVGKHHSAGKTEETAKLQLASCVEQVFIAQPFRIL